MSEQLYDVLAVDLKTHRVRILERDLSMEEAHATANIAVMKRGVEKEFFPYRRAGAYRDGDLWGKKGESHP